jgi:uncharacterized protein (TIGR03437 family)
MLSGTYYFRYVQYYSGTSGNLSRAVSLYNTITFTPSSGMYTISGFKVDSNTTVLNPASGQYQYSNFPVATGYYAISMNGWAVLTNPLCSGDLIWGLVSGNGTFVGSSTETLDGYNDLFVATPVNTALTNSALAGAYTVDYMNYPESAPLTAYTATFQMNSNGGGPPGFPGTIGNGPVTLYSFNSAGTPITSTQSPAVNLNGYNFSNGATILGFPAAPTTSTAPGVPPGIYGQQLLYISPDGNFIFGGAPGGWDFFVGVRSPVSGNGFGGLGSLGGPYYQAGIDEYQPPVGPPLIDSYYGTLNIASIPGDASYFIAHQRLLEPSSQNPLSGTPCDDFVTCAIGKVFTDSYRPATTSFQPLSTDPNGMVPIYTVPSEPGFTYTIGNGGSAIVGIGTGFDLTGKVVVGTKLGINVALAAPQQPAASGSTPYVSPTGVVNAGSYAPFTTGISPGELIDIFGTNLSSMTLSASAPTTTLNGVQVLIDGVAATIVYVSPTQISAVVPYSTTGPYATIQVAVNAVKYPTNPVWETVNETTPGVLTQNTGGMMEAIATNSGGALIGNLCQASPGAPLSVYVVGLGIETAVLGFGAVSYQSTQFLITIGAMTTVLNANPVASIAGLYQVNLTVPAGLAAGPYPLTITGPDSITSQAVIPVGTNTSGCAVQ